MTVVVLAPDAGSAADFVFTTAPAAAAAPPCVGVKANVDDRKGGNQEGMQHDGSGEGAEEEEEDFLGK